MIGNDPMGDGKTESGASFLDLRGKEGMNIFLEILRVIPGVSLS